MNAVEIEEAVTMMMDRPFDPETFPYQFLEAFGNKATTISRLRAGTSNRSDVAGAVMQSNNIHIAVTAHGEVTKTIDALKASPATAKAKAKFVLATDGEIVEAEDLESGETVACAYADFPNHFAFFLALAGITIVKQLRDSSFDIRATSRLNKMYVELLRENPEWGSADRRHDMNHFMARLIFCFFAEKTHIFAGSDLFTSTIERMSARDSSDTHAIISEIFRAMNTQAADRAPSGVPRWATTFPYVNGGLFSGSTDVPRLSKVARSHLLHVGRLDWTKINPDIFGSMIQAVADDDERGSLGMHYTSVPNILKVLNPLFLDDLRETLDNAGDNARKLLNLRNRMARIRVFDPACGSGNFLVIAYREMRAIEAEINWRRNEDDRRSEIALTNFRGIELRDFPAEIARLALVIADFQCDVIYCGKQTALATFLPLASDNWIINGNALRLDWLSVCPPSGRYLTLDSVSLFSEPNATPEIDFANDGGETYICGNPPYLGSKWQSVEQKADLQFVFDSHTSGWKSLDYVAGWIMKAATYGMETKTAAAFVTTNSICQGLQVPILWPAVFKTKHEIIFAYRSFRWSNLASNIAGVTVCIVGISQTVPTTRRLFLADKSGTTVERKVAYIGAYLIPGSPAIVEQRRLPLSDVPPMFFGNMPRDGGRLIVSRDERKSILRDYPELANFIRPYFGSEEMINGTIRWCIWIDNGNLEIAYAHPFLRRVIESVREERLKSTASSTRAFADRAHRFVQIAGTARDHSLVIAKVSSERRQSIPIDLLGGECIVSDLLFAMYDAPLWNMALVTTRLHLIWIEVVCGKLETRLRYSNTLGWNTFPIPTLTEQNKADLTYCAEEILLAREQHFPATIADLYDPVTMPQNLREAHDRNDETLERIYIGRRFKNDTERLEKLFELYSKMATADPPKKMKKAKPLAS